MLITGLLILGVRYSFAGVCPAQGRATTRTGTDTCCRTRSVVPLKNSLNTVAFFSAPMTNGSGIVSRAAFRMAGNAGGQPPLLRCGAIGLTERPPPVQYCPKGGSFT